MAPVRCFLVTGAPDTIEFGKNPVQFGLLFVVSVFEGISPPDTLCGPAMPGVPKAIISSLVTRDSFPDLTAAWSKSFEQ